MSLNTGITNKINFLEEVPEGGIKSGIDTNVVSEDFNELKADVDEIKELTPKRILPLDEVTATGKYAIINIDGMDRAIPLFSFTEPVPWEPTSLEPFAWYDAADESTLQIEDTNRVAQWDDKSGNGNYAIAHESDDRPVFQPEAFNGKPTLRFASDNPNVGRRLVRNTEYGTGEFAMNRQFVTTFTVYTMFDVTPTRRVLAIRGNNQNFDIYNGPTGSTTLRSGFVAQNRHNVGPLLEDMAEPLASIIQRGRITTQSLEYIENELEIDLKLYDNGSLFAEDIFEVPSNFEFNSTFLGIGNSGNRTFMGNIAVSEIIIFEKLLTNQERERVEGYLAWKWNLVDKLPEGHEYKTKYPVA